MKSKLNEFKSRVLSMTVLLVVGSNSVAQAQGRPLVPSHCKSDERIVFSCPFKNGKTASLCASSDLSQTAGTLQYRYGAIGKMPELMFPKLEDRTVVRNHPKNWFDYSFSYSTPGYRKRGDIPKLETDWSTKEVPAGDSVQIEITFTPIEEHPEINFVLEAQAGLESRFQGSMLTIYESGGREGRNIAIHRCINEKTTEHLFSLKNIIKK